jgi:hypothetical protein
MRSALAKGRGNIRAFSVAARLQPAPARLESRGYGQSETAPNNLWRHGGEHSREMIMRKDDYDYVVTGFSFCTEQCGVKNENSKLPHITPMLQPRIYASNRGDGRIELHFVKPFGTGLNLYGQREGEAEYTFLARVSSHCFVDKRPTRSTGQSEVRKFRAICTRHGQETGRFSDEIISIAGLEDTRGF